MMEVRYLLDENMAPEWRTQLLRNRPGLMVWMIGDPSAPRQGTLDPEILIWCEERQFLLVTNNRRSMPNHLADHLANNRTIPGILTLRKNAVMGETIGDLLLIADIGAGEEFKNQIRYIPL
jgi:Domain of unknown function (DUF5615)